MTLLVNSHYDTPWIVYKQEFQIAVEQYGYANVARPHGLPFIPLLIGQWSDNGNFSPAYDLSVDTPDYTSGQPRIAAYVSADATNIHFNLTNNENTKTFYFRLMAYAPPDYKGDVTPVEYNSPFRYNSHYRYLKIFKAGSASGTVSHDLGYIPQCRIWSMGSPTRPSGRVYPSNGIITSSTLQADDQNSSQFYYHIYLDKQE